MVNLEKLFNKDSRDEFYNEIKNNAPEDLNFYNSIIDRLNKIDDLPEKSVLGDDFDRGSLYALVTETISRHYANKGNSVKLKENFNYLIKTLKNSYENISKLGESFKEINKGLEKTMKNQKESIKKLEESKDGVKKLEDAQRAAKKYLGNNGNSLNLN